MKCVYVNILVASLFVFTYGMAKGQTNVKVVRYDSIVMFHRNIIPQYKELTEFSDLLSNVILKTNNDASRVEERLFNFYNSYTSLKKLYDDTQNMYSYKYKNQLDSNMMIIDYALERLNAIQPHIPKAGKVFLFVSAFHENILVHNDIIGIALDRYLGRDFYMYPKAMTKWKIQFSDIHRMPLDAVKGYVVTYMPMLKNKLLTNLDYIRYWANIYDILSKVFEDYKEQELFGFTDTQYQWIRNNIDKIYKNAVSRGDLETYNPSIIDKYFGELPQDKVLPGEAPRQIGYYLAFWMFKTNKLH